MAYRANKLVGRQKELALLRSFWQQVESGQGQICLVSGAMGVGKTSLITAFLSSLPAARVLTGVCHHSFRHTPYYAWKNLLLQVFQLPSDSRPPDLPALASLLAHAGVEADWASMVARILDLPVQESGFSLSLNLRQRNEKFFYIVSKLLQHQAGLDALCIFLEDFHWADELSRQLAIYLARQIAGLPILLLVVTRPQPDYRDWQNAKIVNLAELGESESRQLLRQKLGLQQPDEKLENLILQAGHRQPLYLELAVDTLISSGQLRQKGNFRALNSAIGRLSIPSSLEQAVAWQVSKLNTEHLPVLWAATVGGPALNRQDMAMVLPPNQAGQLQQSLFFLQDHNFLPKETAGSGIGLRHAAVASQIYRQMPATEKCRFHLLWARQLEETLPDSAPLEAIAYHYLQAQENDKAVHYSLLAAEKGRSQYANGDAAYFYRQALALLRPEQSDLALATEIRLAEVLCQNGNYQESVALYQKSLLHQPASQQAELYLGLGRIYQEEGLLAEALTALETALALQAKKIPIGWRLLTALARQIALRALYQIFPSLVRPVPADRFAQALQLNHILNLLGKIYFWIDVKKVAWANFYEVNQAERLGLPRELSLAYSNYGIVLMGLGRLAMAEKYLNRSMQLAEASGDLFVRAVATSRSGSLGLFCNQPAYCYSRENEAAEIFQHCGGLWEEYNALGQAAIGYYLASDFENCRLLLSRLVQNANTASTRMFQTWGAKIHFIDYLRGQASASEAIRGLQKNLQQCRQFNDLPRQIIASNHLAAIVLRQKDWPEAAKLVRKTYALVNRYRVVTPNVHIAWVDLAEAALLLAQTSGFSRPELAALEKITRKGLKKSLKYGKIYPYLLGPALRVQALYCQQQGKTELAASYISRALQLLENSPNLWEKAQAIFDAAHILPEKREENLKLARQLLAELGLSQELVWLQQRVHFTEKKVLDSRSFP